MPARKVCSVPFCFELMPCPDHPKIAWEGSTRRTELPTDWEARRRRVLARDPLCTDGRACQGLALSTECHHIGSKHDHSLGSLGGICSACHKAATSEQATAARRINY